MRTHLSLDGHPPWILCCVRRLWRLTLPSYDRRSDSSLPSTFGRSDGAGGEAAALAGVASDWRLLGRPTRRLWWCCRSYCCHRRRSETTRTCPPQLLERFQCAAAILTKEEDEEKDKKKRKKKKRERWEEKINIDLAIQFARRHPSDAIHNTSIHIETMKERRSIKLLAGFLRPASHPPTQPRSRRIAILVIIPAARTNSINFLFMKGRRRRRRRRWAVRQSERVGSRRDSPFLSFLFLPSLLLLSAPIAIIQQLDRVLVSHPAANESNDDVVCAAGRT